MSEQLYVLLGIIASALLLNPLMDAIIFLACLPSWVRIKQCKRGTGKIQRRIDRLDEDDQHA